MLQVVGCCDQAGGNCLTDAHVALAMRCLSPLEASLMPGIEPGYAPAIRKESLNHEKSL